MQDIFQKLFARKEEIVSHLFFLLSVFFFGVTLLAFNRDLEDIVSWRTILLITSLAAFAIAYFFNVLYTLDVSLIGFAIWWEAQAANWAGLFERGENVAPFALILGLVLISLIFYLAGRLHEKSAMYKHFARAYALFGIFLISGILFVFSTKIGLAGLENMTKGISFFSSWQIALSLFVFILAFVGLLFYALVKKGIFFYEAFASIFFIVLFGIIVFMPQQQIFVSQRGIFGLGELSGTGIFWAILFNIVVFLELLGIIFSGYARREEWLINLGALFMFLLIIVKYADWFFTFLDKSIFFIGAGILLLGVGWFMERGRRYMISAIKT